MRNIEMAWKSLKSLFPLKEKDFLKGENEIYAYAIFITLTLMSTSIKILSSPFTFPHTHPENEMKWMTFH